MKYLIAVGLLFIIGCASFEQETSHWASSMVGLNRVVTLYSANGTVIQQWSGQFNVETNGSSARFMDKGKSIYISGTFTIIEP